MRIRRRRHHRPLSIWRRDLVLADVSPRAARPRPRRSLHRRHRRVHLRPRAEHALGGSLVRHALHPRRARAVRARRPVELRQLRRRLSRRVARSGAGLLRRRRPVHQPVRRLLVLARRVRARSRAGCSSTPTRCSRSSRSPRAKGGTSTSSAASITCLRSAPISARRRATCPTGGFTWHKTWQPVVTELWRHRCAAGAAIGSPR